MSLSLHGGPFNASPSDRRTCKQALCQSTYLKKDLPQRHSSQTVLLFSFFFFFSLTLPHRLKISSLKSTLSAGLLVCLEENNNNEWENVGVLFRHPDDASVNQSIGSEESLVVPHTPGGRSVEVWVIWACWAHYRPPLMDTLKASPDRCGFIKSSAHSDGCCYLCMFVSIRLLSAHFLTQGICLSISSHEGSFPALCAALALL